MECETERRGESGVWSSKTKHKETAGNKGRNFCVPGHARFSVQSVTRSPQSAAVSQPVPKASCGPPPDWAMSCVSSHRRWGRTAGCAWGFEDPCLMDIQGKKREEGEGRKDRRNTQ